MAVHWLREVRPVGVLNSGGKSHLIKQLVMYFVHVLGYTYSTQSVSSGSYQATDYEKTGSNGAFNGTDFTFTDSTASSFVAGDVNKWLLVVDSANPRNSGWYKITGFTSSSVVVIDFRSGPTQYPTSSSTLTWYIMGEDYNIPTTNGDYVRLTTPHADGWELEMALNTTQRAIDFRVSLNADWTGSGKILDGFRLGQSSADSDDQYSYVVANTEGSFFYVWNEHTSGGNWGVALSKLLLFESTPARLAAEQYAMFGARGNPISLTTVYLERSIQFSGTYYFANGRKWTEGTGMVECNLIEYTYSTEVNGFNSWTSREQNARTGGEDIVTGLHVIEDLNNAAGRYAFVGTMQGVYNGRANLTRRVALDDAATADKVHISDGIIFDWPALSPVY